MFITPLIDIGFFCTIRMPTKIKVNYFFMYNPVVCSYQCFCFYSINVLNFSCTFNYITRATCFLPLCTKLIYKRRIMWIRFPTKIKLVFNYIRWNIPVIHAWTTFYTIFHIFVFVRTFYFAYNTNFIFGLVPLVTPSIYVGRCSWIRNP